MILTSFNGKTYGVDFYWSNVSNKKKRNWEIEARSKFATSLQEFPVCMLRVGRRHREPFQYGISSFPELPGKKGKFKKLRKLPMPLILFIVDMLPKNFLGIFKLQDGYWVCAMNSGQIPFDGDRFFQSYDMAIEQFNHLKNTIKWEDIKNGENLVDIKTEEESIAWLSSLISGNTFAGKGGYLNLSDKPSGNKIVTYGLFSLIILLTVYMSWDSLFAPEEKVIPPKPASQLFPKVWEKEPTPKDLFASCENGFEKIPFVENMWMFTNAVCTSGNGLTVNYKKNEEASYLSAPEGAIVDLVKTDLASRGIKHEKKFALREKVNLISDRDAILRFKEFFRVLGGVTTRQILNVQKPLTKMDGEPPVNVNAPYGVIDFSVVTQEFPHECSMFFSMLPGTVLEKVNFSFTGSVLEWTFSGKIYTLARK